MKNFQRNTGNLNSIYTYNITGNLNSKKIHTGNLDSIYTGNLNSKKIHTGNFTGIYISNLTSIYTSIFIK